MTDNRRQIDWGFWRRWVLFNTLGHGLGGVVGWAIANYIYLVMMLSDDSLIFLSPFPFIWLMTSGGVIAGIFVGLAQWLAVRQRAIQANMQSWILGNVVGLAIGWALAGWFFSIFREGGILMALALCGSGVPWGLLVAILHMRALPRQIQHTRIWLALNGLSGVVAFGIGWAWMPLIRDSMYAMGSDLYFPLLFGTIGSIVSWPLAGMLFGAFTAGTTKSIGELRRSRDIAGLLGYLDNTDWMLALEAAEALVRLGDARGVSRLVSALQSKKKDEREVASETLDELGNPHIGDGLSK